MLKLLEVRQPTEEPERPCIELARLDLTENTEAERQEALDNARILYGSNCTYIWHDCGHDEGKMPCTMVEAI